MPNYNTANMTIDELRAEVIAQHGAMLPSIGAAMAELNRSITYDMVWARDGSHQSTLVG